MKSVKALFFRMSCNGDVAFWKSGLIDTGKAQPGPIVEEIAELIRERKQDDRLRWKGVNQVTVNFRATFPAGVKATFDGRKKRFQEGLSTALASAG